MLLILIYLELVLVYDYKLLVEINKMQKIPERLVIKAVQSKTYVWT